MDDISTFILEGFYKDDRSLVQNRRVSAIVGACYLLNLRRFHPEVFGDRESRILSELLVELNIEESRAAELLEEIGRGWEGR